MKPDGAVERYKARLVAKGCSQIEGVDYVESFSLVAKAVTVRILLSVASAKNWPIHQLDINNSFLHGFLDEDIYMTPPEGYSVTSGSVCKLKRSLYGLKQASRQWNLEFTSKLTQFGFQQSQHDHYLFIKHTDSGMLVFLVYVDDVLLTGPCESSIVEVKRYLDELFTIKDLGHAKFFLGLEIAWSTQGTLVMQSKFIRDIIHDNGLFDAKATHTPFPMGVKLTADSGALLTNPEPFRRLVGRLLYLGFARPDISHGAQQLSQFVQRPCQQHLDVALHLVRYLKGCSTQGLFFPVNNDLNLHGYSDVDWATCSDSRKSLTERAKCKFPI
ncbi:UNVERIFIED_CONTAM: Retrovirus-related Pol polyprotein from transposon TNT 1-94 [Sesamum angustifolium]|uniref:Retrovirus-related Pol polyprotein from transposon TNT 1-94 n=1 Tax=Sesamum angustifolium TaxID=2727405 RepID=A0AAW2MJV4_9LAMI